MLWLPLEDEDSLDDAHFQQAICVLIPQASQSRQLLFLARSLFSLVSNVYICLRLLYS